MISAQERLELLLSVSPVLTAERLTAVGIGLRVLLNDQEIDTVRRVDTEQRFVEVFVHDSKGDHLIIGGDVVTHKIQCTWSDTLTLTAHLQGAA